MKTHAPNSSPKSFQMCSHSTSPPINLATVMPSYGQILAMLRLLNYWTM